MIEQAINRIVALAKTETHEINGDIYTTDKLHLVKKRNQRDPEILRFSTLSGLVDFITLMSVDLPPSGHVFLHILRFNEVHLKGAIQMDNENTRFVYASARVSDGDFVFDKWHDLETFIVNIQSLFVSDETTESLLSVVGNLANEHVQTNRDDGVTQMVQVRTGITTKSNVTIENPLKLRPFRTFREINQPQSNFIFRVDEKSGKLNCALFEADGGSWMLQAINDIKEWLTERCEVPVLG